jgi:pimeloyl-ACP methyl ester carboxylesterase
VLLSFGAHAREPLGPRLLRAAARGEAPEPSDAATAAAVGAPPSPVHRYSTPTTFLYGDHDWMDAGAGNRTAAGLRELGVDADCALIPSAGHHLYLENVDAFVGRVLDRTGGRGGGGRGRARAGSR